MVSTQSTGVCMQDKLADLREVVLVKNPHAAERLGSVSAAAVVARSGGGNQFDVEAHMGITAKDDKEELGVDKGAFMEEYQLKINTVKEGIQNISSAVTILRTLRKDALKATSPDQEKLISGKVNSVMDAANRKSMLIKTALESLKDENTLFAAQQPGSSEVKIRNNLHAALTRKFGEVIIEYQSVQTNIKQDVKGKVTRQVKIVYPEASEDELQNLVDGGDAQQIIRESIMGGHESMKNAVSDIQDKYRDIRRLEASVAELHQMFVDLATLVDSQGELLDQIQFSVNSAKDYTEKADKELVQAKKYQASAQRRLCWISVCLVILALCIMLPLVIVLLK
eukprot:GHVO01027630.1.p1 GENE.GHVO01027630.1~~GHVO01027630.1.p1  ORF type:complete len:339 (-),score=47.18 GHVO01027630.1:180-1196(-)